MTINEVIDQIDKTRTVTVSMVDDAVKLIASWPDMIGDADLHEAEDRLHRSVLCAIAEGRCQPGAVDLIAKSALATTTLEFVRWHS